MEGHISRFSAFQADPSCRFRLAGDVLGLRRSGSWSLFIDPPQDSTKRVPGHGGLGQLERVVSAMADSFGPEPDQLLSQRGERLMGHFLRQGQRPLVMRWAALTRRHLGAKMVVLMNHREIGAAHE